jgi:protease PrsW
MSLDTQFRVLYGSPLSRPKVAKFVVIVLAVILVITMSVLVRRELTVGSPDQWQVFLLALFASGLLSIIPLTILRFLDRREHESTWIYVIAFLWGALISTEIAVLFNGLIDKHVVEEFIKQNLEIQKFLGANAVDIISTPLVAPIVEETIKGIGMLLLFWLLRSEFDSVRDGFIYGALVGIGFNFLESARYVYYGYIENGIAPWGDQLVGRYALFGFWGHALFTGMFGLGLGLARQTMRAWLRYTAPIIGWLMGLMGHSFNNGMYSLHLSLSAEQTDAKLAQKFVDTPFVQSFIAHSLYQLIIFFPFFLIVVVMLWQSGRWERQVIRKELASEVEPVITKEEYEAVKRDGIFRTRRIKNINRRTSAAIVQAQNKLAIRKWRIKQKGLSPETDPIVLYWRIELVRLRF